MSDMDRVETESEQVQSVRSRRGRRIMTLVLVILILLLGLSTYLLFNLAVAPRGGGSGAGGTSTNGLTWVRSIYGRSNKSTDLFDQTVAAVPGTDGSVWVTDARTKVLMHFTADGRYIGGLNSIDTSAGPFQTPSRFAVGPDGLFYVCETALGAIRVVRPDGTDAGSFGVPEPVSVAVSNDRIAVGSVYGFAVLDKKGDPIKVFGTRGKGDDQFDYVHGIALDAAGNVYVADSYNNRLSAYDRGGKRLWIIRTGAPANSADYKNGMMTPKETTGSVLKGSDALQLPLGVTIDGAGRLVVADMYDCALAVFDAKTGTFIGKYGDVGADDGAFFYPVSVSYDAGHDWFTVADAFNKRVEIIRLPGSSSGVGSGLAAAARRSLAGPLRACLFPLLLLLIAIAVTVYVWMKRRRRAEEPEPEEAQTA